MENILRQIVNKKKEDLIEEKKNYPLSFLVDNVKPSSNDFKKAISKKGRINLIAEIKKASPSLGLIRKNFHPLKIGKIYESANVDAISVLTEKNFFKGSLNDLQAISRKIDLAILRKDFIFEEYQVYQTRFGGADAFLLISSILEKEDLKNLILVGKSMQMDALIEIHNEVDLEKALEAGSEIIGINNRDLRDFSVNLQTTFDLKKKISSDKIVVSESGIKTKKDVIALQKEGINAVLIGETLLKAPQRTLGQKIKGLGF